MESDRLGSLHGAASRLPWAVVALVMGGFGLAGMPLTAQFAARWALLERVAQSDIRWVLLLLVGALGVMLGALRAGQACFGTLHNSPVQREPRLSALLAMLLVATGVLLAVFPQLLNGTIAAALAPLATLAP